MKEMGFETIYMITNNKEEFKNFQENKLDKIKIKFSEKIKGKYLEEKNKNTIVLINVTEQIKKEKEYEIEEGYSLNEMIEEILKQNICPMIVLKIPKEYEMKEMKNKVIKKEYTKDENLLFIIKNKNEKKRYNENLDQIKTILESRYSLNFFKFLSNKFENKKYLYIKKNISKWVNENNENDILIYFKLYILNFKYNNDLIEFEEFFKHITLMDDFNFNNLNYFYSNIDSILFNFFNKNIQKLILNNDNLNENNEKNIIENENIKNNFVNEKIENINNSENNSNMSIIVDNKSNINNNVDNSNENIEIVDKNLNQIRKIDQNEDKKSKEVIEENKLSRENYRIIEIKKYLGYDFIDDFIFDRRRRDTKILDIGI
jgi:hypothetical protein